MKINLYKSISTLFGLGYISSLPGTLASLVTTIIIWVFQTNFNSTITIIFILFSSFIGYLAVTNNDNTKKDSKEIVIDEFIGQSLVLVFLPLTFKDYFLGFIFFRIFDIFKPIPINYFERKYRNAFGVIFDDVIAAGYALLSIYIINSII